MKKRKFTRKGAFKRYITLRGGRDGIPFCYGALQGGRGEGNFVTLCYKEGWRGEISNDDVTITNT